QDPIADLGESRAEADRGGGFPHTALLVCDGDDPRHAGLCGGIGRSVLPRSIRVRDRTLGALVRRSGRRGSTGRRLAHCRVMITTGPASARAGAAETEMLAPSGAPEDTSKVRPAQKRSLPAGESSDSAIPQARARSAKALDRPT